ncbi:PTS sugar transporter subunit IIA [Vagococcus fluvialis]|uniref:PTS sugar transporter subunit IIA n=1 Tax=Vagococcus fluvialis TaxID=2738 RepID=UPI001A90BDFC|nr:PTS sugar transporter subunit IIA [Vagococcus fluvialis]MBO0479777.1 PTS sugar transporter subunit IIA [Vagococcus fluvialis]MBO0483331.1 PTS sugar transporter subunit IIA [Vagococcus fluvialis]
MINMLPEDQIAVVEKVKDWREAVDLASQPLLKKNLITNVYVENMKQSVLDNGPYMVLTDYFALMHAKVGEGVNEQSMSLLITKEEVSMEGKPVKIFLVLAAEDSEKHLESLQQIMAIFMDDDNYQTIINGDLEKIKQLFNKGE